MPIRLEDVRRRGEEARENWRAGRSIDVTGGYGVTARIAGDVLTEDQRRAAQVETVSTAGAAEEDALGVFMGGSAPRWAQFAMFDGPSGGACPMCQLLLGMVVRVGSREYYEWSAPIHIGCRHSWAYFEQKPEGAPDFKRPPEDLIRRHAHFVADPRKYAPLRVPALPGQQNLSPRRLRDPLTGEYTERLQWVRQPDVPLSSGAREQLQALAQQPQVIPAEAFGGAGSAELQELQRAGYVRIERTLGEPQTMRVTKGTVGEVETFLRQTYAGAQVQGIKQVGALDVGGSALVPQWEVVYAEANARRVMPTKWGRLAVEAEAGAAGE